MVGFKQITGGNHVGAVWAGCQNRWAIRVFHPVVEMYLDPFGAGLGQQPAIKAASLRTAPQQVEQRTGAVDFMRLAVCVKAGSAVDGVVVELRRYTDGGKVIETITRHVPVLKPLKIIVKPVPDCSLPFPHQNFSTSAG